MTETPRRDDAASAAQSASSPTGGAPAADGSDPSIRIQDDLFGHVNGGWLASHPIPADRGSDGTFRSLRDRAEADVRAIIEADDGKIGDLYAAFMDAARLEELGTSPLAPVLAELRTADRAALFARGAAPEAAVSLLPFGVWTDLKDSDRNLVNISQGGLGLPDESYYREDSYADVREKYVEHLARMALLGGWVDDDRAGQDLAARVMAFETELASHHLDVVAMRDSEARYHLVTRAQLTELAPRLDWDGFFAASGTPGAFDEVDLFEPAYVTQIAGLLEATDLTTLSDWAAVHEIIAAAPYLNEELVQAGFDFSGRVLSGTEEIRERWKRGVSLVEGVLGDAVGREFVAEHFPPEAKARMDQLVADLLEAYRRSISHLDWMSPATREKALAKLSAFTPKIGYPKKWRDYSDLEIDPSDLLGSVRRAEAFESAFWLRKVGRPVDRDEWFMTPQTVNAYYNPGMNEIVFPAAILRPPFFDAEADDASNYGGIGAVIGHEVGHGFDDQGSKFDGAGNMVSWWTDEDRAEFEQRTRALIDQYSAFHPRDLTGDEHVNGALTIGENIGDLGGLSIAVQAYRIACERTGASPEDTVDGYTGYQRIFLAWALNWREKSRPAEAVRRLAIDPHSPAEFRCNGAVANMDAFAEAFGLVAGDGLYLPPEQRVRIW